MGCDHDHADPEDPTGGSHHHHHHGHQHHHGIVSDRRMALSVGLTLLFVAGEAAAGWLGRSVALFSDAGHNLADALALGFSWYALWIARRPSSANVTFGYHRVGILAALANAVSLVVIALLIVWEAALRLVHPEPVHGAVMIGVAAVAVAVNATVALWLGHGAAHDLNVRSAYLHMIGDAAAGCAVVVAGILVSVTGSPLPDPIVSFIISGLILWSSWGILRESIGVLLEASPAGLDMRAVEGAIEQVGGVRDVHDLHVWTVGPGVVACSCHIVVDEQTISSGQQVLRAVVAELDRRFHINHTTVQVEVEGCEPNDLYCTIRRLEAAAHIGHHH